MSVISQQRVVRYLQSRFNPIRQLTPEWLGTTIDSFQAGFLREFALLADTIEQRDDVLMSVVPKRKKAIGRNGYEVLTLPDADEAEAKTHQETLKHFYDHITATNAINENETGGFKLLVRQMADAIGKKYAVHEIVWKPGTDGLTAEFRFAPLWFFENRTGRLRYLPIEGAIEGVDLDPNNWLITVGDGLMIACAIAYMFKNLSLKDWLIYSERFGMPIPIGETNAPKDSPEWNAMLDAVQSIMAGSAAVKNVGENITLLETKGQGILPYEKLIERLDRLMASMWRGADLSTMSARGTSKGTGASVQGEESEILERDDTEWITETLTKVSRFVIKYTYGVDEPLAYLKVLTTNRQDVEADVEADTFLLDAGAPLDVDATLERYGREKPKAGAELLKPLAPLKKPGDPGQGGGGGSDALGNVTAFFESPEGQAVLDNAIKKKERAEMISVASQQFGEARRKDFNPLAVRLLGILDLAHDDEQRGALIQFKAELPKFLKQINQAPTSAPVLAGVMSAAFFNGLDEADREREAA